MKRLGWVFDKVLDLSAGFVGVVIVLQVAAVVANVFTRTFLGFGLSAVLGLTEWSLIYIAFIGAAWLERERGHVSMDAITGRFPVRSGAAVDLIAVAAGIFTCAVLIYYGTKVSLAMWATGEVDFFRFQHAPQAVAMTAIPIGAILLFIQLIRRGTSNVAIIREREAHAPQKVAQNA